MRKSRLNSAKHAKLVECFVAGTTTRCIADLIGINLNTAAYYSQRLREIIVYPLEQEPYEVFAGEIEVDKSYLGGAHVNQTGARLSRKSTCIWIKARWHRLSKIIADGQRSNLNTSY